MSIITKLYRGETHFDFVSVSKTTMKVSFGLVLVSLLIMVVRPFNLSIDFKKAYDSINREAILTIMDEYNFPPHLINVMLKLLTDSKSFFALPQGKKIVIWMKSGVKQGCLVSCYSFILGIDLLNGDLETINEVKAVRSFVDDINIMATTIRALSSIFRSLEAFSEATGMQINLKKTVIILHRINPKLIPRHLAEIKISHTVRYLGIKLSTQTTTENTWKEAINKSRKVALKIKALNPSLPRRISLRTWPSS